MSRRVLMVDDDAMARKVVTTVLDLEEYDVVVAGTGREALAVVADGGVDAVVLDHDLPDITGLEVLARLRSDGGTAGLPVVLLTAVVSPMLGADPLDAGAQAHIAKPFSPLHLVDVLDGLLS